MEPLATTSESRGWPRPVGKATGEARAHEHQRRLTQRASQEGTSTEMEEPGPSGSMGAGCERPLCSVPETSKGRAHAKSLK